MTSLKPKEETHNKKFDNYILKKIAIMTDITLITSYLFSAQIIKFKNEWEKDYFLLTLFQYIYNVHRPQAVAVLQ